MRALAALALAAAAACHHGPDGDADERGHAAAVAMGDYTSELNADGTAFQKAISHLEAQVAIGADKAFATLNDQVLPVLDRLLAAGDRALTAADAYLATGVALDEHTAATLTRLRGMNGALHQLRIRLGAIKAPLTDAGRDELEHALLAAGTALTFE